MKRHLPFLFLSPPLFACFNIRDMLQSGEEILFIQLWIIFRIRMKSLITEAQTFMNRHLICCLIWKRSVFYEPAHNASMHPSALIFPRMSFTWSVLEVIASIFSWISSADIHASDQHGKIISRDELEKILAKEKSEELEVLFILLSLQLEFFHFNNWMKQLSQIHPAKKEFQRFKFNQFQFLFHSRNCFGILWMLRTRSFSSHLNCAVIYCFYYYLFIMNR